MSLSARQKALLDHLQEGNSVPFKFLPLSNKESLFLEVFKKGGDFSRFDEPFFKSIIASAKPKTEKKPKKQDRMSKLRTYYLEAEPKTIDREKKRNDLLDDIALMALDIGEEPGKLLKRDIIKKIKESL